MEKYLGYSPDFEEIHIDGDIDSTSLFEYGARTKKGVRNVQLFEGRRYFSPKMA